MGYRNLQECVADLEKVGQLRRIDVPVDPYLELAHIQRRAFRSKSPALLFTRVKGCSFPMLANLFGTTERLHYIFRDSLAGVEAVLAAKAAKERPAHTGCPGTAIRQLMHKKPAPPAPGGEMESQLTNWPVQIKLVPTRAPYFDEAELLIAADCTAFAYADFHSRFLAGRVCLIGCPKLDGVDYTGKLAEILRGNSIRSVTVLRMEVPCCGGLEMAARRAVEQCGKDMPWQVCTVHIDGTVTKN